MSTYIILERAGNVSVAHAAESREALACEIAKQLMSYRFPAEMLMAVDEESTNAIFGLLQSSALCALDLDEELEAVWRGDVQQIHEGMKSFKMSVCDMEADISNSLSELNEVFELTEKFTEIDARYDISISDAIAQLSLDETEREFYGALEGMFKFRRIENGISRRV